VRLLLAVDNRELLIVAAGDDGGVRYLEFEQDS